MQGFSLLKCIYIYIMSKKHKPHFFMKTFCSLLIFMLVSSFCGLKAQNDKLIIGLSGNAYVTDAPEGAQITSEGLASWNDPASVVSVYFYLQEANDIMLSLNARGHSSIEVAYGNQKKKVKLDSDHFTNVEVGQLKIKEPGYVRIDIRGIKKQGETLGEIKELIVDGVKGKANYVTGFSDYWGRRGPSVHLAYTLPQEPTEWFYNEIKVPKNGEVMHSYYMAAGFGEGYFGMQFNSPTERRILFSVWSPFETQDPKLIPEEDKIKLLARGEGVHIGEFGNEGSGGQSYLKYNWKAGETYPFLMRIRPDGKGNTTYTAYFFATEENQWRLIASFMRPKTDTWYKHAHSFLENFSPDQGYLSRKVIFTNQWSLGKDGVWRRVTEATFTHDATANARVRLDFRGGLEDKDNFYLQMGGFFNESTTAGTKFDRTPKGKQPQIDIPVLEKMIK